MMPTIVGILLVPRNIFSFRLYLRPGVVLVLELFRQIRMLPSYFTISFAVTTFRRAPRWLSAGRFVSPKAWPAFCYITHIFIRLYIIDRIFRHECFTAPLSKVVSVSLSFAYQTRCHECVWSRQHLSQPAANFSPIDKFCYMSIQCISNYVLSTRSKITGLNVEYDW